jgi:hypothetical protein
MSDKFQGHQIVVEAPLSNVALPVRSTLDDIAGAVNSRLVRPLNVTAQLNTTILAIANSGPYPLNDNSQMMFPPVSNTVLNYAGETLDISTGVFSGGSPALTLPTMTVSTFWPLLLMVSKSNLVQGIYGSPQTTFNLAVQNAPPALSGTAAIALVIVSTSSFNIWNVLTPANIISFAGGGGAGGSGSGSGAPIQPADGYRLAAFDLFPTQPTDATSKVQATITNAPYNIAKAIYQINCDKSKTFTTSALNYTISGVPSYTVKAGDIIFSGTTWRRIATVVTSTTGTLDVAFPTNLAAAAGMVSQAVWTTDVVNAGDASNLLRPRDLFPTTDVTAVNITYQDSLAVADNEGDITLAAELVVSASNSGLQTAVTQPTSDTFSPIYARPAAPNQILDYPLSVNSPQQRLFLAFFPNPNNVLVTVHANLIQYTVSLYQEVVFQNGGYLNSAFCFTDASVPAINCSQPTVVGGKTQLVLNFPFVQNLNIGTTATQIDVILDGKILPRQTGTSTADASWNEVLGSNNIIQLWTDLHLQNFSLEVRLRQAIIDNNPANALRLNSLYDAVVGSAAQVAAGIANYTTLTAALPNVPSGGTVLMLRGIYAEVPTITQEVHITGQGRSTVISGICTFGAGSLFSSAQMLKFGSNIVFNASAIGNIVTDCWQQTGGTIGEGVVGNNLIDIWQE